MFLCLSLSLNTIMLGIHEAYTLGAFSAWLALPMIWAIYNAIPPLLFFAYAFASTKFMEHACFWAQGVSTLAGLGAIIVLFFINPTPYQA